MSPATPADAEVLQPCPNPWCESHEHDDGQPKPADDIWELGDRFRVQCPCCPIVGPHCSTEAGAAAAWNTRTTAAQPSEDGSGWRLVPVEPTPEMLVSTKGALDKDWTRMLWKTMLAAAPPRAAIAAHEPLAEETRRD